MTISTLAGLDKMTAAGILARAALSLDDRGNPAAAFLFPNERSIRAELLASVRRTLGIPESDNTSGDLEKIADALDDETDKLVDPIDSKKILEGMSAKGELPSDLYHVSINEDILEWHGKRAEDEARLIEMAVRFPDQEQHFCPNDGDSEQVPLISLFSRYFENRYSNKSFTMLVSGIRNGLYINVSQAWRIYSDFTPGPSKTLLDLLKRFAEEFGVFLRIGGQKSKFFIKTPVYDKTNIVDNIQMNLDDNLTSAPGKNGNFNFILCHFDKRRSDGTQFAVLTYAINLARYRRELVVHGSESERMSDWAFPIGQWHKVSEATMRSTLN